MPRKLSKSETRLLGFFGAAIFLALNLFAIRFWMTARRAQMQETSQLQAKIAEDRSWIEMAAEFHEGTSWLADHRPPAFSDDGASTALVDAVRKAAESQNLAISVETLLPATSGTNMAGANLQIKLAGAFTGVARLLFDLQRPDAWRSIDKLTLRSDSTPPNTLLEFQVRQYYSAPAPPAVSANP